MLLYQQLKNIYHLFQSLLWKVMYGMPDKGMRIFGVTGTNGKTTTSFLLTGILAQEYGAAQVGMLTTVAFRVGEKQEINETKMTTLPSRMVWQYLARMKKAGVKAVVLEITSHALDQNRLYGIKLDGGIILNIEREHLDYHQTMEAYAAAKSKIISYLRKDAPLIGKGSDARVEKILQGAEKAGYKVVRFTSDQARHTAVALPGDVNRENALAVSLLARSVAIAEEKIRSGVMSVTKVPGRMESITAPQGFTVIIDYAVTSDALEQLYAWGRAEFVGDNAEPLVASGLTHGTPQGSSDYATPPGNTVRRLPGSNAGLSGNTIRRGKVYGVLGACGMRDRGKRPEMARVVKKHTDFLAITREDPWTESEEQIFGDLEKGLDTNDNSWKRIVDRKEALRHVLSLAKAGDVVVATGKGAETGMAIGNTIVPWNEKAIVEELLGKLA